MQVSLFSALSPPDLIVTIAVNASRPAVGEDSVVVVATSVVGHAAENDAVEVEDRTVVVGEAPQAVVICAIDGEALTVTIVAFRSIGAAAIAAVDDDATTLLVGTAAAGHDVRVVRGEEEVVSGKIRSLLLSLIMNL